MTRLLSVQGGAWRTGASLRLKRGGTSRDGQAHAQRHVHLQRTGRWRTGTARTFTRALAHLHALTRAAFVRVSHAYIRTRLRAMHPRIRMRMCTCTRMCTDECAYCAYLGHRREGDGFAQWRWARVLGTRWVPQSQNAAGRVMANAGLDAGWVTTGLSARSSWRASDCSQGWAQDSMALASASNHLHTSHEAFSTRSMLVHAFPLVGHNTLWCEEVRLAEDYGGARLQRDEFQNSGS